MTNEEAINRLKNTAWLGSNRDRKETEQAVELAIEALSVEPSDLISRKENGSLASIREQIEKHPYLDKTDTDLISREDIALAFDKTYCEPCREEKNDHNGVKCRACWVDDALDVIDDVRSRCEVDAKLDSDLISRADAINAFDDNICIVGAENAREVRCYISETIDKIKSLPSVSTERVVRCKDCEYRQDDISHNFCEINSHKCYDDDFCSWAKMKGGE